MNKKAGIRNAYKKQPFLDRQVKKFDSGMVSRIETPNANFGKDNIPNNKENCCCYNCRENSFPSFYIFHPVFKTVQKRYQKGSYI